MIAMAHQEEDDDYDDEYVYEYKGNWIKSRIMESNQIESTTSNRNPFG